MNQNRLHRQCLPKTEVRSGLSAEHPCLPAKKSRMVDAKHHDIILKATLRRITCQSSIQTWPVRMAVLPADLEKSRVVPVQKHLMISWMILTALTPDLLSCCMPFTQATACGISMESPKVVLPAFLAATNAEMRDGIGNGHLIAILWPGTRRSFWDPHGQSDPHGGTPPSRAMSGSDVVTLVASPKPGT